LVDEKGGEEGARISSDPREKRGKEGVSRPPNSIDPKGGEKKLEYHRRRQKGEGRKRGFSDVAKEGTKKRLWHFSCTRKEGANSSV